jgi:hypothetical protein
MEGRIDAARDSETTAHFVFGLPSSALELRE